uniref:Rho guanine nucleotide exchange factor (GEF) 7a n=1 Tax=Xiphophorus couchianus TaxID=32473 RepID=A0A3B5MNL9_9TELE
MCPMPSLYLRRRMVHKINTNKLQAHTEERNPYTQAQKEAPTLGAKELHPCLVFIQVVHLPLHNCLLNCTHVNEGLVSCQVLIHPYFSVSLSFYFEQEKNERYLMLFPHILLMLSASPRMSGFIFQGKLPLTGMIVTKLEDCEAHKNAFELNGTMFDRLQVVCANQQDLQDWVEHLTRQIKHSAATAPSHKPLAVPCHTLPSHPLTPSRHAESRAMTVAPTYHTLPHPSSHGTTHSTMTWGPLEPPNTPKPWSLSCLRPAPPLRPSAALCYKEDLSKSPKSVKKLLPKRKPERKQSEEEFALRKSTAALEEDAQILKVIEAYCTSAKTRQTLNSTWQGTDLMHNHVLADMDQSCMDSPGRRSSVSRPELSSDLSEDSDYDSIWTSHSYRMGSVPRKSCISHQN